jgi:GTP cyclohydrolase FolE2
LNSLITREQHDKVLNRGVDIPEQQPSFAIDLTRVGISAKTVWVRLQEGRLPFMATISVDLPASVRGIHMSRIEQAITELADTQFADIHDYAVQLGLKTVAAQRGSRAFVELSGKIPLTSKAVASGHLSSDSIDIHASAQIQSPAKETVTTTMIGATVCHLTACPCTLSYNRELFEPSRDSCPLFTHSQRSHTELQVEASNRVRGADLSPSYGELIQCLESALHVAHDLLKRPDEAELVLKAHQHPQFAEDAVRETARAAGQMFGKKLPPESRVNIHSRSLESIHIHDVCCSLQTTLGEILAISKN